MKYNKYLTAIVDINLSAVKGNIELMEAKDIDSRLISETLDALKNVQQAVAELTKEVE